MHSRVEVNDDGLYKIGSAVFDSLSELVKYYSKNCLFQNTKLLYPVPPSVLKGVVTQVPIV